MPKRPLSVTVLSWIYIVMGTVGFMYHLKDLRAPGSSHAEALMVEVLRITAIAAGYYMLKAKDWARWAALAWIAAHVVISFFHSWQQALMHAVFWAIFTAILTRPAANVFFRNRPVDS